MKNQISKTNSKIFPLYFRVCFGVVIESSSQILILIIRVSRNKRKHNANNKGSSCLSFKPSLSSGARRR